MLGWRKASGTLVPHYSLNDGNHVDLVLLHDQKPFLPIAVCSSFAPVDIESSMMKLEASVGLVFGRSIDVFYRESNSETPKCIWKIRLDESDVKGAALCEALCAEEFSCGKLDSFCRKLIELSDSMNDLKHQIYELIDDPCLINQIVTTYFAQKGFDEDLIVEAMRDITIVISENSQSGNCASKIDETDESETSSRDNTRFSIDGVNFYPKRDFVLKVVKRYVLENPDVTYEDLEQRFPSYIISKPRGVVRPLELVNKWIIDKPDLKKRYCLKPDEIITLKSGEKVVVYNQWGTKHFPKFLNIAKTLFTVTSDQPYEYEIKDQTGISISSKSLKAFIQNKK
jgi:hypothetical protein